ncbi:unnamed protein product [Allacma fusca]|uniref:PHR domain-containing protein n=1 Tax=Allacma fusca TaxID=39272 RepID=A0A8J2Q1B3_9HEXA|nr:unnamed protein product [Allacma fusca]
MYSISFRANRSILIKALSFWGPFRQERENYNLKVIVSEQKNKFPGSRKTHEVVLDKFEVLAEAENSKMFVVQCPRAIRLEKGNWIRVRFQLDGAETCVCSSVSNSYYLRECDIEFDFLDSSHQVPEIYFELTE